MTARLPTLAVVACSGCVATIGQRLTEIDGVDAVEGIPKGRWIRARKRPDITKLEAIMNAMLEAGYPFDIQQSEEESPRRRTQVVGAAPAPAPKAPERCSCPARWPLGVPLQSCGMVTLPGFEPGLPG